MFPANLCTNQLQLRFILEAAKYFNVDTSLLLETANVTVDTLKPTNSPVPIDQALKLWHAAQDLSQDPLIALKSGTLIQTYQQSPLFSLVCSARTIRDGSRHIMRYQKNNLGIAKHSMSIKGDQAISEMVSCLGYSQNKIRPVIERQMSIILTAFRILTPAEHYKEIQPEIYFQHKKAGSIEDYHAILGNKVYFGHERNLFVFPRKLLDIPNPMYCSEYETSLIDLMQRYDHAIVRGSNLITQVNALISNNLANERLNIDYVAKSFTLSPRTLQRRLQEQGTNFNELLNNVRQRQALIDIKNPHLSMGKIAKSIGFRNQSAFNQAFLRWTDLTPRQYREKELNNPQEPPVPANILKYNS